MKMILPLFSLIVTLTASAQTVYFNQWFTNLSGGAGYVTNSFQVESNTLAVLVSPFPKDGAEVYVDAYYQQGTVTSKNGRFGSTTYGYFLSTTPILGPCTAIVYQYAQPNQPFVLVWRLDSVNTVASPNTVIVQPAGFTATIGLETSTNLTTWQTLTNASFGKTNSNRFFRMSLTIP